MHTLFFAVEEKGVSFLLWQDIGDGVDYNKIANFEIAKESGAANN